MEEQNVLAAIFADFERQLAEAMQGREDPGQLAFAKALEAEVRRILVGEERG